MIRADAQLSVSRFAELIGVPRHTYHYRLARHRAGELLGVWSAPVLERIEPTVAKYAQAWPAWGHRKVWALARADGHDVGSPASVARAMRRQGLLQPVNYQAERRRLAQARRAVFVDPPTRRKPGLAVRLLRVGDRNRWHLAARRHRRLPRQGRARVSRVGHDNSGRHDRRARRRRGRR